MSYDYSLNRSALFTDEGQRLVLRVRDHVLATLKVAGAIRMDAAMRAATGAGDSWTMLAAVDRLVELGDIREIDYGRCAGQHRIFVAVPRD